MECSVCVGAFCFVVSFRFVLSLFRLLVCVVLRCSWCVGVVCGCMIVCWCMYCVMFYCMCAWCVLLCMCKLFGA